MLLSKMDLLGKAATDIARYSPLIVQSDAGAGKSFFVNELCKLLCENGTIGNYKIRYSWDILNSMIEALSKHKMSAWRNELLDSELIVIEEFHFLNNKSVVLEELYQIFRSANVPIIITTDMPIVNETTNCTELVAFLEQSTRIILPTPTHEDIEEYLRYLIQDFNIRLSDDASDWLMKQKINTLTLAKGIIKTLRVYSTNAIDLEDCISIVRPFLVKAEQESI